MLRYLVGAGNCDVLLKRTLDQRAAYLDVYALGRKALNRRDGFHRGSKKARIVYLSTRDLGYQRQPTLIYEQMEFAAELARIGWIWARILATRWTVPISTGAVPDRRAKITRYAVLNVELQF